MNNCSFYSGARPGGSFCAPLLLALIIYIKVSVSITNSREVERSLAGDRRSMTRSIDGRTNVSKVVFDLFQARYPELHGLGIFNLLLQHSTRRSVHPASCSATDLSPEIGRIFSLPHGKTDRELAASP